MKQLYTIFFCIAVCTSIFAQNNTDSVYHYVFVPTSKTKATIHLKNTNTISGDITKITDSILSLSTSGENQADSNIAIGDIQNIKIKRNAFWLGMGSGAVGGSLVGYGLGYITYSNNPEISDIDNKDDQHARAAVGAVIVAVPGAVIGSIVGTIGTKRNFVIDGKNDNIRKMIKSLWELK